ncbi:MAG: hypothetical protein E5W63_13900, partial [Mesorhizobium sp.]
MLTLIRRAYWGVTVLSGVLLAQPLRAADMVSPVTPDLKPVVTEQGWTYSIAPYFWAAGLSGDVTQFGLPTVHLDASFGDILK